MTDTTLCRKLAEAVGAGASPLIPRIFEALVNDDEARVLLVAAPSATAEELAQKTGLSAGTITTMMETLFNKGLIFKAKKGGELKFYRVKNIPQMHDSTSLTPGISRDILNIWKEYMEKEWPEYGRIVMEFVSGSIMRVVPVNEGIEPESRILAYDDVVKIIENAKTLSVKRFPVGVTKAACGNPRKSVSQLIVPPNTI